jgi:hypothetical protein
MTSRFIEPKPVEKKTSKLSTVEEVTISRLCITSCASDCKGRKDCSNYIKLFQLYSLEKYAHLLKKNQKENAV